MTMHWSMIISHIKTKVVSPSRGDVIPWLKSDKKILAITIGLPGSGKSTWAEEQVSIGDNKVFQVTRDDFRRGSLRGHSKKTIEKMAVRMQNLIVDDHLRGDNHVIVADTNLNPERIAHWYQVAENHEAAFYVVDFTNVPFSEILRRNSLRKYPVPAPILRSMATAAFNEGILLQEVFTIDVVEEEQDDDLPEAIIVDIDGTIAKMKDRGPFEWDKVDTDGHHVDVINLILAYEMVTDAEIILVSGRDEVCREKTIMWLRFADLTGRELHMRKAGDNRKDSIIKREIYEEYIKPRYNVIAVFDDRSQVVDMWRSLGLRCYQVAHGEF